ncbi:ATP-dependent DNA helicase RecG [Cognatiyoonia sediminum]|uniref:ATP-dependent DNA helicase RecG n=1 Tax=Cognatiyoonia sediminum TaxID=1508389 RepID=A0A1M5M9Z8_9RHOB|nr:ATP-dependent DNA helicase RecG [Cognatiyoonia sediminum]SHG73513.1 ATP-dependent DNA helicase RecG [Cognatiyoonia sediminum]
MSTRPEILFPLFGSLTKLDGIGPKTAQNFEGLGVEKPRDLLFTLPYAGIDRQLRSSIRGLVPPATITVEVTVQGHKPNRQKGRPYRVVVSDNEDSFQLVFFHARGDYLQKLFPTGQRRVVSGKLEVFDSIAQMVHPEHVLPVDKADEIPAFEPVYPLTAGVTQKVMWKATRSVLERTAELQEWIDPSLKAQQRWPDWHLAITSGHAPQSASNVLPTDKSRERLAYDELMAHQLTLALARATARRAKGRASVATGALQKKVLAALRYDPTGAQTRAIGEIVGDLREPVRMNRLLQGDVGSGKTLVAIMALLAVVEAGGQGVLMAPTEILARQHLEGLRPLAESAGVVLEILTGRDKGAERAKKLVALDAGDIQILVGTHAVFQKGVEFKDLRLAVIDEQHRFGVAQRMQLGAKGEAVDVLVMTATPIPRSLALAQYGDMDVSILDEKPPGRTPVQTALVSTDRLDEVVEKLRKAVADGKQAYWVCPLVEESEVMDMTAAEERFKHLRAALGEGVVGLVHGQMPLAEKDEAMAKFVAGETPVLVATTVIEVGVNVPNASIMMIERAESFGLAQLHQLRGRVGRGAEASTCLMLYQNPLTETGRRRLEILRETEDGFRISEEDLAIRGAGDVIGTAQSGLPRFRIADLESQTALMARAQKDARKLLHDDPSLETERGQAARVLLWLMEQDKAIRLISVG